MTEISRVAYFCDSYQEVNGVAMTSKRLEGFALRRGYPFLVFYAGGETKQELEGSIIRHQLKHSPAAIPLDHGLAYDPLFMRHTAAVTEALREFRPDVIHITGLNDVSILGAYLAWKNNVPMLASWHTNLHEYSARRLDRTTGNWIPNNIRRPFFQLLERQILRGAVLYYKQAQVVLAPNQELIDILQTGTKRPARLMIRGVDTELYAPHKRTVEDGVFRFGFVGRLQPEKNVRLLVEMERALLAAGASDFKFLIVGDGNERAWLEQNLQNAEFTGFIYGEKLAEAYANMDVFVFPSETDAYGNVVQEANAAGVPVIVSNVGGPKFIVQPGTTGYIAEKTADYARYALELMRGPSLLAQMRESSRRFALSRSWDGVFERVYQAYAECRSQYPYQTKPNLTVAPLS